jgi:CheY-like chemotaxis protein
VSAFNSLPPAVVRAGEDPLAHYLAQLESNGARFSRSPSRRLKALFGKASATPTVLWVDDHPENNRALRDLIEERGIRVRDASDTERAMALLRAEPVDLVITDMGRGDDPTAGLELLRAMRAERLRHPAAVFASMRAVAEYGAIALDVGAAECTAGTVKLFQFLAEHLR